MTIENGKNMFKLKPEYMKNKLIIARVINISNVAIGFKYSGIVSAVNTKIIFNPIKTTPVAISR